MKNNEKPVIICTEEVKEALIGDLSRGGGAFCDELAKRHIGNFTCTSKKHSSCADCLEEEIDWKVLDDPKNYIESIGKNIEKEFIAGALAGEERMFEAFRIWSDMPEDDAEIFIGGVSIGDFFKLGPKGALDAIESWKRFKAGIVDNEIKELKKKQDLAMALEGIKQMQRDSARALFKTLCEAEYSDIRELLQAISGIVDEEEVAK